MRWLIKIYIVSHSVFYFSLKPLSASVDMSKFKDRTVQFRNAELKRLTRVRRTKDHICVLSISSRLIKAFIIWWQNSLPLYMRILKKLIHLQGRQLCQDHFVSLLKWDLLITKTPLFNHIENFTIKKKENFQIKKVLIFFIFLLKT